MDPSNRPFHTSNLTCINTYLVGFFNVSPFSRHGQRQHNHSPSTAVVIKAADEKSHNMAMVP